MPTPIMLGDAIEGILDAIVEGLDNAREPDGLLDGLASVVRGDRTRTAPPLPSIWVFAETAVASHGVHALAEEWTLPVVLTPVVKRIGEPEEGYRDATHYAARGRSAVLRHGSRTLGLRDYVQDVQSGRFEPSAPWHSDPDKGLFSAVAVVNVIFRIREPQD